MSTPSDRNPYQPPKADVSQQEHFDDELISGGQTVPAGNAMTWISGGWMLFLKSPGIWIVTIIIMLVLSFVLGAIPFLGGIASTLITPVFIGGLMLGCRALDEGEEFRVDHLFAGFREKGGQLALVGLLILVGAIALGIAVVIVIVVAFGSAIWQSIGSEGLAQFFTREGLMFVLLCVLVIMALAIPLAMAYWYAPALVVFHNLDAMDAMKQSFLGCLRNFIPFLLYGVVFLILAIIAAIPFALGFLVLIPMGYCSMYVSYKDIYLNR